MSETYRAEIIWQRRWPAKKQIKVSKMFTDEAEALRWMIATIKTEVPMRRPTITATLVTEAEDE